MSKVSVIVPAGTALEKKTGGWRVEKPIVTDKCRGCGFCTQYCPEGVIKIEEGKAKIDYDYCKGCLICKEVCPFKAIESVMEK